MITYLLILIISGVVYAITYPISALPDVVLPANITANLATLGHFFGLIWGAAPLTLVALFSSVGVIIVIENNIAIYKVVKWIYSKIPGVN